jgi:glutamate dehydrogenase
MVATGVDEATALRAAGLLDEFSLLDVADLAASVDEPVEQVAGLYFAVSARYAIDAMLARISGLDRSNRWGALARGAMRDDLYAAWMGLTRAVLDSTDPGEGVDARLDAWERANRTQLARAQTTIDEVRALEHGDLAAMSVALRALRGMIRAGSST